MYKYSQIITRIKIMITFEIIFFPVVKNTLMKLIRYLLFCFHINPNKLFWENKYYLLVYDHIIILIIIS